MLTEPNQPILHFFRGRPRDLLSLPPLASSLQTLETCFFEIGLRRFPHALVSCATATESASKAKLAVGPDEHRTLESLLDQAQTLSPALRTFSPRKLDAFRITRNRIIHYGFSPADDEECANLLLATGLPFLKRCYSELFDFFLDWRDIRPGNLDWQTLPPEELDKAGLLFEVAEQLRFANDIFLKRSTFPGLRSTDCLRGFAHYIRWGLKETAMTGPESEALKHAEEVGHSWELEEKQKKAVKEHLTEETWEFCCPICTGFESLVAELDMNALEAGRIRPKACFCVKCGFVVPQGIPFVSEVLLGSELAEQRPKILKEFGISEVPKTNI